MYKTRKEIQKQVKDFHKQLEEDNEIFLLKELGAKEYVARKKIESQEEIDSIIRMHNSVPRIRYII